MKHIYIGLGFLLIFNSSPAHAETPPVIISEIAWMGTNASANAEWIELHNTTAESVDLAGWTLESSDGSPKIMLSGTISADGYFLLERTTDLTVPDIAADLLYSGTLSNTAEWLVLKDDLGATIDAVDARNGWPGGDNASKQTLQRNDDLSWQTSAATGGSPKTVNPAGQVEEPSPEDEQGTEPEKEQNNPPADQPAKQESLKGKIVINEAFPDPFGEDTAEFIELKNVSATAISLEGWRLGSESATTMLSLTMYPNSIVVFNRTQTGIVLRNTADHIKLQTTTGEVVDELRYTNAKTGLSIQRDNIDKLQWFEPSAGENNKAVYTQAPEAVMYGPKKASTGELIIFDGSDSFDPSGNEVTLHWNFGDGRTQTGPLARQVYASPGSYTVLLVVKTQKTQSTTTHPITILSSETTVSAATSTATSTPPTTPPTIIALPTVQTASLPALVITEFMPDPDGADTDAEFIEVFNADIVPINLRGFRLADAKTTYTIKKDTIIEPGQYYAFFRSSTKISLNNDEDEVVLLAPGEQPLDAVAYSDAREGESFILDESGNWVTTATPSPGEINILSVQPVSEIVYATTTPREVLGEKTSVAATTTLLPPTDIESKKPALLAFMVAGVVIAAAGAIKWKRIKTQEKQISGSTKTP